MEDIPPPMPVVSSRINLPEKSSGQKPSHGGQKRKPKKSNSKKPESSEDKDAYEVERVTNKKVLIDGSVEYYVFWKDFPPETASWVSQTGMDCHELIEDYERNVREERYRKRFMRRGFDHDETVKEETVEVASKENVDGIQESEPVELETKSDLLETILQIQAGPDGKDFVDWRFEDFELTARLGEPSSCIEVFGRETLPECVTEYAVNNFGDPFVTMKWSDGFEVNVSFPAAVKYYPQVFIPWLEAYAEAEAKKAGCKVDDLLAAETKEDLSKLMKLDSPPKRKRGNYKRKFGVTKPASGKKSVSNTKKQNGKKKIWKKTKSRKKTKKPVTKKVFDLNSFVMEQSTETSKVDLVANPSTKTLAQTTTVSDLVGRTSDGSPKWPSPSQEPAAPAKSTPMSQLTDSTKKMSLQTKVLKSAKGQQPKNAKKSGSTSRPNLIPIETQNAPPPRYTGYPTHAIPSSTTEQQTPKPTNTAVSPVRSESVGERLQKLADSSRSSPGQRSSMTSNQTTPFSAVQKRFEEKLRPYIAPKLAESATGVSAQWEPPQKNNRSPQPGNNRGAQILNRGRDSVPDPNIGGDRKNSSGRKSSQDSGWSQHNQAIFDAAVLTRNNPEVVPSIKADRTPVAAEPLVDSSWSQHNLFDRVVFTRNTLDIGTPRSGQNAPSSVDIDRLTISDPPTAKPWIPTLKSRVGTPKPPESGRIAEQNSDFRNMVTSDAKLQKILPKVSPNAKPADKQAEEAPVVNSISVIQGIGNNDPTKLVNRSPQKALNVSSRIPGSPSAAVIRGVETIMQRRDQIQQIRMVSQGNILSRGPSASPARAPSPIMSQKFRPSPSNIIPLPGAISGSTITRSPIDTRNTGPSRLDAFRVQPVSTTSTSCHSSPGSVPIIRPGGSPKSAPNQGVTPLARSVSSVSSGSVPTRVAAVSPVHSRGVSPQSNRSVYPGALHGKTPVAKPYSPSVSPIRSSPTSSVSPPQRHSAPAYPRQTPAVALETNCVRDQSGERRNFVASSPTGNLAARGPGLTNTSPYGSPNHFASPSSTVTPAQMPIDILSPELRYRLTIIDQIRRDFRHFPPPEQDKLVRRKWFALKQSDREPYIAAYRNECISRGFTGI